MAEKIRLCTRSSLSFNLGNLCSFELVGAQYFSGISNPPEYQTDFSKSYFVNKKNENCWDASFYGFQIEKFWAGLLKIDYQKMNTRNPFTLDEPGRWEDSSEKIGKLALSIDPFLNSWFDIELTSYKYDWKSIDFDTKLEW